jgi:tetratricopeptide (TPR) repeat protein
MKKCPSCGKQSEGAFCSHCGTALHDQGACPSCGARLPAGARFCTKCGQAVGAAASKGGGSNLPWYLLGAALVALALLLVLPYLQDNTTPDPSAAAPFAGGAAGGGAPPPLTGTPREQADALFNRIMSARESGDSTGAVFFTPMAIQAYGMAEPLDDDGRYHLALVHTVAGNHDEAVATAEQILEGSPQHLLALAAAAEAEAIRGNLDAARAYARRFLDAYPTERDRQLQEYVDHAAILPEYEREARALVEG